MGASTTLKQAWVAGEIALGKAKLICCLIAVSLLAGCRTAEKRQATVQTPAPPPSVDSLPLKPPQPKELAPLAPAPDPVEVLVHTVDDLYESGMADYREGNLEEAKKKFDQALETLLQSNLDVQSDNRLRSEFNKVVENVYGVEVAALERGDLLTQTYEPAPIESFAGLTFPVDPRVKQRVQRELKSVRSDLPLVSNDYVDGVLTYFQGRGREFVEKILQRVGKYRPMIEEALREEGVPKDLIYLAAAESAFNPFAVSRAGAKGIWQFMRGTGKLYGLKGNRWVDERQDPVKSTQAAARHLKDLYQQFGDWYLAMAAYDSGPLTVQRAIERTGYADYWELRKLGALPRETENYVPIFIATALIAKDPKSYGFDVQEDPSLKPDQVVISTPTDLRLIAQLIDHPVEDLVRLNPSLLRWTTPANDPQFVLYLPPGTKDKYEETIAAIPADKRIWWRVHKVSEGDTLASVARKFHISLGTLAEVNQMSREDPLEEGSYVVLPFAAGRTSSLMRGWSSGPGGAIHYRIRRGDTLSSIARHFGVTTRQIQAWNEMSGSRIIAGQTLRLRGRTSSTARSGRSTGSGQLVHYRIRRGDTLQLIADRFDVTVYQIRRWNGLKGSRIVAGKTLRLYVRTGNAGSPPSDEETGGESTSGAVAKEKPLSSKSRTARKMPEESSNASPAAALPAH